MEGASWAVSPSPDPSKEGFDLYASEPSDSYIFDTSIDSIGTFSAVPRGGATPTGVDNLDQNEPLYTVKFASWTYSASSRSGHAVYINGLDHQWAANGLTQGAGRKNYLQRYVHGTWQTILSKTADAHGKFTVGFIQSAVYQYRWITFQTGITWGAASASTFR